MTVPQVSENQPVVAPSNPRKLEDKAQYVASFPIGMTRIMRILIHDNYKYKHTHAYIYVVYNNDDNNIFLLRGIIKHQQPPIRGVTFRGLNAIYTFFLLRVDVLGTAETPESLRNGRSFSQHSTSRNTKKRIQTSKTPNFFQHGRRSVGGAPRYVGEEHEAHWRTTITVRWHPRVGNGWLMVVNSG